MTAPRPRRGPTAAARAAREPATPSVVPLSSPALIAAALVAALLVGLGVSYRIHDPDLWQHLLVGKAIWTLHRVPTTELWTWPTYGVPDVDWSWAFRALLWPVWNLGGISGLYVWRWVTALAAIGVTWATCRRLGARGFSALPVLVVTATVLSMRSMVRPEGLAAILWALELWVLETRRQGGPDRTLLLPPLLWAWANVHLSNTVGFATLALYAIEAMVEARARDAAARSQARRLALLLPASLALALLNPFGWRALWQPFHFLLFESRNPIFATIGELMPVQWGPQWQTGLPLLVAGWPLLILLRARRGSWDVIEAILCAVLTVMALRSQRFTGPYALAAAPFMARSLAGELASLRMPAALRAPWARALCASAACLALTLPQLTRPEFRPDPGFVERRYPIRAADFIAAHGVRGRFMNCFEFGGYLLWRFWPEKERLPFMDIHQAGTDRDRYDYAYLEQDAAAWAELDGRYHFDAVLWRGWNATTDHFLDTLDRDSTWALVFRDDPGALFVRRGGALAALADSFAYRLVPAGSARLGPLGAACAVDSALRGRVRAELERMVRASPWHALAKTLLANAALQEGDFAGARTLLDSALAVNPWQPRANEMLGLTLLELGRTHEARQSLAREAYATGWRADLEAELGGAAARDGDRGAARGWYERALRRDPSNAAARDSLATLGDSR